MAVSVTVFPHRASCEFSLQPPCTLNYVRKHHVDDIQEIPVPEAANSQKWQLSEEALRTLATSLPQGWHACSVWTGEELGDRVHTHVRGLTARCPPTTLTFSLHHLQARPLPLSLSLPPPFSLLSTHE